MRLPYPDGELGKQCGWDDCKSSYYAIAHEGFQVGVLARFYLCYCDVDDRSRYYAGFPANVAMAPSSRWLCMGFGV